MLDLISMFFYNYQDQVTMQMGSNWDSLTRNACFFGDIFPIKAQMTQTGITHTNNNGLLDLLFYMIFSFWIYKIISRKI